MPSTLKWSGRLGVGLISRAVSPSTSASGAPSGASVSSTRMPSCSSERPSSRSEQIIPSDFDSADLASPQLAQFARLRIAQLRPYLGERDCLSLGQLGAPQTTVSGCSPP